jgi:hypothetical protein
MYFKQTGVLVTPPDAHAKHAPNENADDSAQPPAGPGTGQETSGSQQRDASTAAATVTVTATLDRSNSPVPPVVAEPNDDDEDGGSEDPSEYDSDEEPGFALPEHLFEELDTARSEPRRKQESQERPLDDVLRAGSRPHVEASDAPTQQSSGGYGIHTQQYSFPPVPFPTYYKSQLLLS